jgi:hypothetical protein
MKNTLSRLILAAVIVVAGAGMARAATITFSNTGLKSLDHFDYFVWGIEGAADPSSHWSLNGEAISSVSLKFVDIWNNDSSSNALFVHLLQTSSESAGPWSSSGNDGIVTSHSDNTSGVSDKFAGKGYLIASAIDEIPTSSNGHDKTTLAYTIPEAYYGWLTGSAPFYIGIDPDCHFYDSKVELTIETQAQPVPEPASMTLLGLGLVGSGAALRRRNRNKQA